MLSFNQLNDLFQLAQLLKLLHAIQLNVRLVTVYIPVSRSTNALPYRKMLRMKIHLKDSGINQARLAHKYQNVFVSFESGALKFDEHQRDNSCVRL